MSHFKRPREYKLKLNRHNIIRENIHKDVFDLWICIDIGVSRLIIWTNVWLEYSTGKSHHNTTIETWNFKLDLSKEENQDKMELWFLAKALSDRELRGDYEEMVILRLFKEFVLSDEEFLERMTKYNPEWVRFAKKVLM